MKSFKQPSKIAPSDFIGQRLPYRNVKVASERPFSIMDARQAEARFNRFIAEYQAMAMAQSIIARIQDQSRFYHFWRYPRITT